MKTILSLPAIHEQVEGLIWLTGHGSLAHV